MSCPNLSGTHWLLRVEIESLEDDFMKVVRTFVIMAAAVALQASTALAQSDIAPRTAISFVGGFGSTTRTTGVALGGSVLFDLNDRTSLEAEGTYVDRGTGADALRASSSLLVNLVSASKQIVPYAAVGGGVYRASFDLANPRFLGPVGTQFAAGSVVCPTPGTGMGPGHRAGLGTGSETCPATGAGYWGAGQMSGFYARRLGALVVPVGGAWETRSFTDPAVSVGGGVRVNVTERLMLRPDLRALVVFTDGETHTLGVFVVNLGYRF
jgi:hypothetical protein